MVRQASTRLQLPASAESRRSVECVSGWKREEGRGRQWVAPSPKSRVVLAGTGKRRNQRPEAEVVGPATLVTAGPPKKGVSTANPQSKTRLVTGQIGQAFVGQGFASLSLSFYCSFCVPHPNSQKGKKKQQ